MGAAEGCGSALQVECLEGFDTPGLHQSSSVCEKVWFNLPALEVGNRRFKSCHTDIKLTWHKYNMFYYLYEIKNLINNKIYVGVHKTNSIDDGYMGSGKVILRAIKKYGIENFSKTILETFENSKVMFAREKEVVTDEFLARVDTYNLRRGGSGGFDYINKIGSNVVLSEQRKRDPTIVDRVREIHKQNKSGIEFDPIARAKGSKKCRDFELGYMKPANREKGMQAALSDTSRNKRLKSFSEIGHQVGPKNSQFGMMWITTGTVSVKIKKESLIPDGWRRGRIQQKSKYL